MTPAEPFLRVALAAVDEAGDPTAVRPILEAALVQAQPLISFHKPANAKKVIAWAATQMAMSAEAPARAYSRLRELLAALFEPLAGGRRGGAPAPEVAMAMPTAELLEALAPAPRILHRAIAGAAKLDLRALLADPSLERRVLGVRAIPLGSIGAYASELAAAIVDASVVLRAEALATCERAADKSRLKIAEALQPIAAAPEPDDDRRAAAIDGLHGLRFQLDNEALLAALRDPAPRVRAAATRTIGTGRRGYGAEIEARVVELIADADAGVRIATLGAIVRMPSLAGPGLIEPLRAAVARGGEEAKTAVFLLGRLGAQPNTAAIDPSILATTEVAEGPTDEARAYVTAGTPAGMAVSDRGTGKQLFIADNAFTVAFVPGRAELAAIRTEAIPRSKRYRWHFERYRIPDGTRLGSIEIPLSLSYGMPSRFAIAGDLATVWCEHDSGPYRFHVKLGAPDRVIDDAPVLGRP